MSCDYDYAVCVVFSITNLKYWGRSEPIISRTLQLLNDLSVGYSCVRKLVKLDAVQFLLANHTVRLIPTDQLRALSLVFNMLSRLLLGV